MKPNFAHFVFILKIIEVIVWSVYFTGFHDNVETASWMLAAVSLLPFNGR